MKLFKRLFWPIIGTAAIVFSIWLLYHELRGLSLGEFKASLFAIPMTGWILAGLATLVAYAALAAYDHLALEHLGHRISIWFITLTSFTTYALSHNIGASVFSGAVVRYRAYSSKGLTASEVGVLVAFCSFTFALGTAMLFGIVMLSHQIGGFLGAYLGGSVFQATGSYDWVWYIDVVLAVGAALVNLPIREARVARPAATAA